MQVYVSGIDCPISSPCILCKCNCCLDRNDPKLRAVLRGLDAMPIIKFGVMLQAGPDLAINVLCQCCVNIDLAFRPARQIRTMFSVAPTVTLEVGRQG